VVAASVVAVSVPADTRELVEANAWNWLVAMHDDARETSTTKLRTAQLIGGIRALAARVEEAERRADDSQRAFALEHVRRRGAKARVEELTEALREIEEWAGGHFEPDGMPRRVTRAALRGGSPTPPPRLAEHLALQRHPGTAGNETVIVRPVETTLGDDPEGSPSSGGDT
jgi:hypothetical protein